jgi:hypothetical protein
MSGNNGDKQEKTQEQLKEERHQRYLDKPNSFIEVSELACAAMLDSRSQLGISVMVGETTRAKLDIAQVELNHIINRVRIQMDVSAEMHRAEAQRIQQPGAMHRFANRIMGK